MSYMRSPYLLSRFESISTEYIFGASTEDDKPVMEDYGTNYDHKPSMCELERSHYLKDTIGSLMILFKDINNLKYQE